MVLLYSLNVGLSLFNRAPIFSRSSSPYSLILFSWLPFSPTLIFLPSLLYSLVLFLTCRWMFVSTQFSRDRLPPIVSSHSLGFLFVLTISSRPLSFIVFPCFVPLGWCLFRPILSRSPSTYCVILFTWLTVCPAPMFSPSLLYSLWFGFDFVLPQLPYPLLPLIALHCSSGLHFVPP